MVHHAEGLRRETNNKQLVAAVVSDFRKAPISEPERKLLEFALKLAREPAASAKAEIDVLRNAAWSDGAILDATLIISYFAFVNRIAKGLGVELEGETSNAK